ncbi:prolipoprotein diacylglyceryl transferase [Aeoliella mucimassa]|uniref:Uncharacterized protein n=1 Tax=Aeoliella mucimassa TaxID=2527972 RepID=A0A518AQD4_9BACT|nr:hypothetical protein [Aeoliella mucimassa]QDU56927.1 hypothetical protein Pan181_31390 [Aeoliella mucimassa]
MSTRTLFIVLVVLLTAGSRSDAAELPSEQVAKQAAELNQANKLLADGDLAGAMAGYEKLQELGPPSPVLKYNYGLAHYKQGDIAAAAEQFESVAAADDDRLAANARFNLGNCDYVTGLQMAEKDRSIAIERLQSAIRHYRSALEIDSTDDDTRANIELAARMIDRLREQQEQEKREEQERQQQELEQQEKQEEPEQKEQEQQEQEQNESSSDQENSQQSDGQQQESMQQESDQENKSQPSETSAKEEQQNEQQSQDAQEGEQTKQEESADQSSDSQEASAEENQQADSRPDSEQRAKTSNKKPASESNEAEAPETQGDQSATEDSANERKQPPQGELSAAESQEDSSSEAAEGQTVQGVKEGEMTEEEAEKMLQAIRDREMLRRLRRQAAERDRHIPVDRDW